MDRAALLKRLDTAWGAFQDSYAGLSAAELIEPGVTGDWSVQRHPRARDDVGGGGPQVPAAHPAGWHATAVPGRVWRHRRLQRLDDGAEEESAALRGAATGWTRSTAGSSSSSGIRRRTSSSARRAFVVACGSIPTITTRSTQRRSGNGEGNARSDEDVHTPRRRPAVLSEPDARPSRGTQGGPPIRPARLRGGLASDREGRVRQEPRVLRG